MGGQCGRRVWEDGVGGRCGRTIWRTVREDGMVDGMDDGVDNSMEEKLPFLEILKFGNPLAF